MTEEDLVSVSGIILPCCIQSLEINIFAASDSLESPWYFSHFPKLQTPLGVVTDETAAETVVETVAATIGETTEGMTEGTTDATTDETTDEIARIAAVPDVGMTDEMTVAQMGIPNRY